ncbi:hypothetical protein G5C51_31535 [Streptomyces sp. A7024]|uniref:Peptidase C39-like domain-containing protein n=1 Tax=Streptomyces coryli TaxID=1128680 RepID=A0A6G4UAR7_9ACTN|nr:C39 family peptidase [Streptomyces coryli]NGN68417.1 hypothetical protein [Streptomyces coryli]
MPTAPPSTTGRLRRRLPYCLPVAHVPQARDHWCGPATARMLLAARLGDRAPTVQAMSWMAERVGGTYRGDLRQVLNWHLPEPVYVLRHGPHRLRRDVARSIDRGFGLALNLAVPAAGARLPGYPPGPLAHWVAVIGYDPVRDRLLILDPAAGRPGFDALPRHPFWMPRNVVAPAVRCYLGACRPPAGSAAPTVRSTPPPRWSPQVTVSAAASSSTPDSSPLPHGATDWCADRTSRTGPDAKPEGAFVTPPSPSPAEPDVPTAAALPRRRRLVAVLALLLAAVAAAALLVADLGTKPAAAASAVNQPISRGEVIDRAESWVNKGLTYTVTGETAPDPQGKPYRKDCSGYVSMAWHLDRSRVVSTDMSIALVASDISHEIGKDQLQPGDALVKWDQHVRLFERWTNAEHTRYLAYDFGATPVKHQEYTWNGPDDYQNYQAFRYNRITDDNGAPAEPAPPQTEPARPQQPAKYWVDTFAAGPGRPGTSRDAARIGTLNAGTNYVWCKKAGDTVRGPNGAHNRYWLWTDLDSGAGQGWVSAYYLTRWGNDEARDNSGQEIPDCAA